MKYALIGCGRISPNHIAAAKANKLETAALCDLQIDKAYALAEKFALNLNEVRIYDSVDKMLCEISPELCAVATQSGDHAKTALKCIGAGCNVIIEKPVALSLADADKIIALAKKNGVVAAACHQNRFNRAVKRVNRAVQEGELGRLLYGSVQVRWNRGEAYYKQAAWRGRWNEDGGALMNQCIHAIDILRRTMGSGISEVFAYTDNLNHPYIEAEDTGLAVVRFKNGAYGIVEGTTCVYPKNLEETITIFGTEGTVKLGGKSMNAVEIWQTKKDPDGAEIIKACSESPPDVYGFGHTPFYKDVVKAIAEGREPAVTAQQGKNALEAVLAIYKSAAEGRAVRLPLKSCASADFAGRFDRKER